MRHVPPERIKDPGAVGALEVSHMQSMHLCLVDEPQPAVRKLLLTHAALEGQWLLLVVQSDVFH